MPPPRASIFEVSSAVALRNSCSSELKSSSNALASPAYMKCTCPIFSVPNTSVLKPPRTIQNAALFAAAATTELSSMAMGTV